MRPVCRQVLGGVRCVLQCVIHGIGLAIARRFAGEGAEVVVTDLDRDALPAAAESIALSGPEARTYELDVTDGPAILALKDRLHADAGPVDVLINNAGLGHRSTLLDGDTEHWREMLEVNAAIRKRAKNMLANTTPPGI